MEIKDTPWTDERKDEARKFFLSDAGQAFLTDLHSLYKNNLVGLTGVNFRDPESRVVAAEIQAKSRAFYEVLSNITTLMEIEEDAPGNTQP